jgi:glucose-1-phosphate thymidylyltransferase
MKGIILHGGSGTRLRPLTYSGPKQLIPIANKPVSQYALEDLISCGVREVAVVLGQTFPELVKEHYGDGSKLGVKITYVLQERPLGIAHAIGLCRDFVGKDDFIVYLGDNMLQHGIGEHAAKFQKGKYDVMVLLKEVEEPSRFGVAQLDASGKLVKLVEKPKKPPSNYAVIGVYFLRPSIFESIRSLKPSWRGELEVTDAIQGVIDKGLKVGHSVVDGWWFDTGKKDDILNVNALVLDERAKADMKGKATKSKLEGRVQVAKGTRVVNSTIRGPVAVGEDCLIENSTIGPHTSIGKSSRIKDSHVEYCVMLEGAEVEGVERLEESLIGRHAKVTQDARNRRSLKVHLGDFSEVVL